jgi:alpha-tubulin suppressor-like RCC1 family protein
LGHENPAQSPNEFRLLKSLQHEHIIQISFSDFHACALGKNGTVYSWGCPDEGRLGLGQFETSDHHSTIYQPTRIDFFKVSLFVICF